MFSVFQSCFSWRFHLCILVFISVVDCFVDMIITDKFWQITISFTSFPFSNLHRAFLFTQQHLVTLLMAGCFSGSCHKFFSSPVDKQTAKTQSELVGAHFTTIHSASEQDFTTVTVSRGAVVSWLVHSSLDRAVRVRALAGDFVFCSSGQNTLLSQCLSPPCCINGYWLILWSRLQPCNRNRSWGKPVSARSWLGDLIIWSLVPLTPD